MNGKPIATDLQVLEGFAEPFLNGGMPRDERMAKRWGCNIKQVYALWNKPRFDRLIDCGVSLRSGWLTDAGKKRLAELRLEAKALQSLQREQEPPVALSFRGIPVNAQPNGP